MYLRQTVCKNIPLNVPRHDRLWSRLKTSNKRWPKVTSLSIHQKHLWYNNPLVRAFTSQSTVKFVPVLGHSYQTGREHTDCLDVYSEAYIDKHVLNTTLSIFNTFINAQCVKNMFLKGVDKDVHLTPGLKGSICLRVLWDGLFRKLRRWHYSYRNTFAHL